MIRTSVVLEETPGVPTTATTDISAVITTEASVVSTATTQVDKGSSPLIAFTLYFRGSSFQ